MSSEELLRGVPVEAKKELDMETPTDEPPLTTGEVTIDLDLADGVDYDVDDHGDGTLVIQYWATWSDGGPDD